jgi:hypothetical protein
MGRGAGVSPGPFPRPLAESFFSQMFTEPHSTKPIEDCIGWGLETTAETLCRTQIRCRPDQRGYASATGVRSRGDR